MYIYYIALGKVGAVVSLYLFKALATASSYAVVMGVACAFTVFGALITYFFIDEHAVKQATSLGKRRNSKLPE